MSIRTSIYSLTVALALASTVTNTAHAWPSTVVNTSEAKAVINVTTLSTDYLPYADTALTTDTTPVSMLATTPTDAILTNSVFGLAITQGAGPSHRTIAPDPWEGFNRFTFGLNDKSDKLVFKPLARGYRAITTKKMRKAMRNFLTNIATPTTLVNDILQGKLKRAAQTGGRFVINSAIGFGGVADPAKHLGIPGHTEDFGQTLAVWGIPSGPYVVLPFFGPSTIRDSLGLAVDRLAFSPLNYIQTGAAQKARLSRTGATLVSLREPLLETLDDIENNSLDYYSSFRSFYLQARRREILDGKNALEDLPDIGDGFDDFDEFDEFDELDAPESSAAQTDTNR